MPVVDTDLVDLVVVVRRTVAARTGDVHLIEDVTQETIVKVAEARHRLTGEHLRAYAIVTARNTLAQHYRRETTARRHAHRLVEYRSFDGPEQLTLEREETDALASALERLEPADRELLLAHESAGTSLDSLAEYHRTSTRAISMRLSRARAALRVEFVLALRGIDEVSTHCRNTLHALSSGDGRRQRELGADAHLRQCPICSTLAEPVSQRRRGLAAWLLFPIAEGVRRAALRLRTDRITQVATVAVAVAGLALGYLAIRPDERIPRTASDEPASIALPGESPPTTVVPAVSPVIDPCGATMGAEVIDASMDSCPFATTAMVLDVPADEGFWITAPDGMPAWVHLVGADESPAQVVAGQTIDITGVVRAHTLTLDNTGAPSDQAAQVMQRSAHLEVAYGDLIVV